MDEAVLRFRVGIFVLFSFIILGVLIFLHIEGFQSQYSVYVKPESAPGVTKNTPVRKNGLLIGRVANVKTEDDLVNVHLKINVGENIYENETVSFGTESFLGDAVVEIIPARKDVRGNRVGDGAMMEIVEVKPNPMKVFEAALDLQPQIADALTVFQEAGLQVKEASQSISSLSDVVENALNDKDSEFMKLIVDARKLSTRADTALANFNRVFENLNNIVGDPELKGKLNDAIANLPELLDEISLTFSDTRETVNSYREVSERAVENLENLEPFTAALQEDGPRIVKQVNDSLARIDEAVGEVTKFTDSLGKIGDSKGTLGKILNDPELYDNALRILGDVKRATSKMEAVMNDVRTFTDAIARDPRQLGLKGMADRKPLGAGYKASPTGRDRVRPW